jgi:8-oxo-dGTP diphosphatase
MAEQLFVATKGFITNNSGEVLILKESNEYEEGANSGKWDIVGGRVDPGQRFDRSLKREIKEESGIEAKIGGPFYTGEWRSEVKGHKWQIVGTYFKCSAETEEVSLSEDHEKFAWIKPSNYKSYDLVGGLKQVFERFLEERKQFKAAGKAVIINKNGEILVMKRSTDETHLQEYWDVPGGSLNHGELPEKALKRETMEEARMEIDIIEPINTWTYVHDDGTHRFGATYLCKPKNPEVTLSNEHIEYRWVGAEELEDLRIYDELREGLKLARKHWGELNDDRNA